MAQPKATVDCVNAFGLTDFRADAARIDVPTLFIHGHLDKLIPPKHSAQLFACCAAAKKKLHVCLHRWLILS